MRGAVKSDIREVTAQIAGWCDEVYPTRTAAHMIIKLQHELKELLENPMDAYEIADVAIILFDLCNYQGFDLATIIHRKMEINRARAWAINEQGILSHVKAPPA